MKLGFLLISAAFIVVLFAGCASNTPPPGPAYYQATYQAPQTYKYPPQTVYPSPQTATPAVATAAPSSAAAAAPQTSAAPVTATTSAQAQAGQPEVIPPSPGPDYVWMPSYWTMGLNGSWVWVGGHYVLRQGASEEQLRAARGMLEQSRAGLTGKALKNVDKAIEQINNALAR